MKKIEINPKTAGRIKELLRDAELTQKELADLIFCSPQHINRIVQGKCGLSQQTAEEIAKHYSVRVPYLLGLDDYKTEGALWKSFIEKNQIRFNSSLKALISLADAAGINIVLEDDWKIKRNGETYCSCSGDEIHLMVKSMEAHVEQYILDFINIKNLLCDYPQSDIQGDK